MEEKKKENGNGKAGTQSFGNGVPDVRDCARVKQKRGKNHYGNELAGAVSR